ncbi:MAG: DNA polymerase III subunit gamma/tau, partial [Candidatus Colwellbacteria bacterium]|nr:DNA polymerase III subunit gamma/tau [Candidatus Colwellbacteria bacterium]
MSLALYRRYRPRTLADVIGQDPVVGVLRNAAWQNKIGHAYLFYGPRGSGKTTAARILAKLANCEKRAADERFRETGEPCNACRPCAVIDEGRALDVLEIDAASNRGIDEVRSLKEGIRLSPTSHRHKVFIIDEAHQLTKEAFNALLKMLEEPPPHAIFVLATTEFEKIPATIASRTQRLNFKRVPIKSIKEKLGQVVKGEGIRVNEDALELIAASADGSFRDAESLLEQVISLGAGTDVRGVEQLLGKVGFRTTAEIAGFLLRGDLEGALEALARVDEAG